MSQEMSPGVPQLDGRFLRRDLTRNPWIWRTISGTFALFAAAVFGLRFALPDIDAPAAMYALSAALGLWAVVLFRATAPAPGSAWAHAVVASVYVGPALAMLAAAPHGVIGVPASLFAGPLIGIWMARHRDAAAHLVAATIVLLAPAATGLVDVDTFLGAISVIPAMWVVTFCIVIVMSGVEAQGDQLDALVRVDTLTGVGNRRALDELLDVRVARAAAEGPAFALLTLDLDGFKAVNDQLGHDAGDALLRHVAACLITATDGAGTVIRQGGDEFCVVLDSAAPVEIGAIESRIRTALADLDQVAGVPVSSGIGRAVCPADGDDADALLAIADARLLADKADRRRARAVRATPFPPGATGWQVVSTPPADSRQRPGEGPTGFPDGIGRVELEGNQPVWRAHALMYLIYTLMGMGVSLLAPEVVGPWFAYVWLLGVPITVAYLALGPPRIGTSVNHAVVALTYVVPALIIWSCAPGGSFATGTLLFVGPLAATRIVVRWQVGAHVAAATLVVVLAMVAAPHDVWTKLVFLQTIPVVAILAVCCVVVFEIAEQQTLDLHRLVRRDPLTDLANRRLLLEELGARSASGVPFSVITFDLNGFKDLNDTLGHAAGDELLRNVATCLTSTAGPATCVARQGGDEFAVIHPAESAMEVEAVVTGLRFELGRMRCAGRPLTTGIGWAIAPVDGTDPSALLSAADRRLLADKAPSRRAATAAGETEAARPAA